MHRQFRKLLEKASGESQHIIAIVSDIRGFTPFCATRDSVEVATYVKRVYTKIMDDFFPNVSFCKPTGDGLLLVLPCELDSVKKVLNNTIESCLNLSENFSHLCRDDPLINFETPRNVGIGLSRGSACCISSEEKTLDYSGRVLNLASRLMDVARPSGVVFDSGFGFELLSDENKAFFAKEPIYIRGIAEEEPMIVYYTMKRTIIPDFHKNPIREPKWNTDSHITRLEGLKKAVDTSVPAFYLPLQSKPLDQEKIMIRITFHAITGYETMMHLDTSDEWVIYKQIGRRYLVMLDIKRLFEHLKEAGAKDGMDIRFDVEYLVK